ncbi:DUF2712 domain-containing protein [Sporolactobacillus shoreicorticis]|uniref:DUF2712 domain-containing protein n=1 Tax=Sporolactobacillus shoreicorticis TaxID=1923877 RepID=A0ABW5RYW8_9BACL|nr:DUF2712 domain-containing protein [Sporolactobacillus shoreicorticis]MCO7128258.1 DUF2712 domain-containing protein [Sporolactobacillus shoreicorticis]
MKKRHVIVKMVVALLATVVIGFGTQFASAKDNDIGYKFKVYGWMANGKETEGRYRQTDSIDNSWKVQLKTSGEGQGTITGFWLENSSAQNVSQTEYVKQGEGPHYQKPFASANKRDVWLTAQNNNFNGESYTVKGIWDEETW